MDLVIAHGFNLKLAGIYMQQKPGPLIESLEIRQATIVISIPLGSEKTG